MTGKCKKSISMNTDVTTYQLPPPCTAKYLVVVVDRGMASEVMHFISLEEAKTAFGEIANDYGYDYGYGYGYEPEEINGSDYYDVSIWERTEDKYEKVCYYV